MHEDHNYHNSLEVLNISNYNAKGEAVLNDEMLLELVQIYPFLYNPLIKPFRDPDYDDWAWNNIATAFNKTYGEDAVSIPFSVPQLRRRWEFLQPIIIGLGKVSDSIPSKMRSHVLKISVHLENPKTITQEPLSDAQRIIFENIEMVEKLPLQQRKQLEAEIMRLILASELEDEDRIQSKEGETFESDTISLKVQKDCEEFFQEIGIDELSVVHRSVFENNVNEAATRSQSSSMSNGTAVSKAADHKETKILNTQLQVDYPKDSPSTATSSMVANNSLRKLLDRPSEIELDKIPFNFRKFGDCSIFENDLRDITNPPSPPSQNKYVSNGIVARKTVPPIRIKLLSTQPQIDNPKDSPSDVTSSMLQNYPLLMPLERPRWIELDKVPFYIRKCRVRLKRFTPPEDELPLARLKEEYRWLLK